ncbi:uncharacterized protein KQ657_001150 [Scheffersomyces spartinae]|uniref:Glutathione S-transferase n=1 Tax=Scheffersomyces spartinae TaxID=45513 RepID=A0A9P8AIE4_9ASCO|nr:uncharacterized protein KQ657_001150 [Scheffersomyces spartinae]KAG7193035.1 hypothetical protein KQ657_001150 [Scheffersomyces spartinae]
MGYSKDDLFTLHWLDNSRAHRILWLLELLGLNYEVKIYFRHPKTWRAPPELFRVHPLGKSPILDIDFADGSERLQLLESGNMIQYLLKHYDFDKVLAPKDRKQRMQVDYFLHYTEGTLQHLLISLLVNSSAKNMAPFPLKSVTKLVGKGINNGYYKHEFELNMIYLENHMRKQGTGFFVGDKLSGADIILSFPIYENVFDNMIGVKECTGEKRDMKDLYPQLAKWSKMVSKDPAYRKINKYMEDKVEEYVRAQANL